MPTQATLVLVKPDAVKRHLTGAVLWRLEDLSLELVGAKMTRVSCQLAEEHYKPLREKPFFEELIRYIRGEFHAVASVLALVYFGEDAIARVRRLAGATNPEAAEATTLRGAFGRLTSSGLMENVIHASSDEQEAEREIKLWFCPEELTRPLYAVTEAPATGMRLAWA